ncbi:MAG: nucleotidyltransferase family protein [Fibrobacter sp.]|nr:nucleotidyltransferase family protein [Fibrobacter sp.]
MQDAVFFEILRAALGQPFGVAHEGEHPQDCATLNPQDCATLNSQDCAKNLSPDDCKRLFMMAKKQSLYGIAYDGVKKMGISLPRELALNWSLRAEAIRGYNDQMNSVAAHLTKLFEGLGRKTAILKGQANARLYPNPAARQPGDIDIWVSGGKAAVLKLLEEQGLMEKTDVSEIHAHLPKERFGIDVEVHFVPCGCNYNPIADRHMQKFLRYEIERAELVPEGFYAPSLRFAMVMQLSHIRRHFFGLGIGFRQLVDYFVLIQNSSEQDRKAVAQMLAPCGLRNIAGAVMYVLQRVFELDERLMLCKPDSNRGEVLLREVLADGNFGAHASRAKGSVIMWWLKNRLRILRLLNFDFGETLWLLLRYWGQFAFLIPMRIGILKRFLSRRRKKALPKTGT